MRKIYCDLCGDLWINDFCKNTIRKWDNIDVCNLDDEELQKNYSIAEKFQELLCANFDLCNDCKAKLKKKIERIMEDCKNA